MSTDKKYLKQVFFYLFSACISVGLILYIGYHLANSFGGGLETTTVSEVTENKYIDFDAYIFRSESPIYASSSGGIASIAADGSRVAVGNPVASVYYGDGDEIKARIAQIDEQLKLYEATGSTANLSVKDTSKIDSEITKLMIQLKENTSYNRYSYASSVKTELISLINKRKIIINSMTGFDEQIEQLKNERTNLIIKLGSTGKTIYTQKSGYYYADTDGYENIFNPELLSDISADEFYSLIQSVPEETAMTAQNEKCAGKIVTDTTWYIACPTDKNALRYFSVGDECDVAFAYNALSVKMEISRIINEPDDNRVVLIFETNIMPEGFAYTRVQPVKLIQASYTGYKLPLSAIRIVDGVQGVYVLVGKTVHFRRVETVYETDGYSIVQGGEQVDGETKWLELHDSVIIAGKNLYDGKIVP